jgi:hypothetical protein
MAVDSATSDHSTPIPISHDACASRTHIFSDRPLIRLRFVQAQKLYCQVRKCDLQAVAKLHEPGDSPATARPMADAARTTGGGMVHVARFVAQLREGLKLACDADSSAYRIYWYGYEPEGREFESPRARHSTSGRSPMCQAAHPHNEFDLSRHPFHVRLLPPEPLVVEQPQSTRVEEPTLLCNQVKSAQIPLSGDD